jgi:hypothetical protein
MRFIGLEEINPYNDLYEYKIFKYDDKIELGNKDSFVCDLRLITLNIEEAYIEKNISNSKAIVTISNLNEDIDISKDELNNGLVYFILEELPLLDINQDNIDIEFIKS